MICMFCQRISIIYSSRILWLNTPNESWIPVHPVSLLCKEYLYSLETSLKRCLGWMWRRIRSQIKKSRLPVNPLFQARLPIPPLKLLFQALLPLIQNLNQSHLFFLCWFFICLIFCFFLQTKTNVQERGVKENEMIQCNVPRSLAFNSKFVSVSSVVVFKQR